MTTGEAFFLDLLVRRLPGRFSAADVDAAVRATLMDAARVQPLARPAHLYIVDAEFREVAEGLLGGRLVRVPDGSGDVSRYQLLGATRNHRDGGSSLRFRNGLVEKTISLVRDVSESGHELAALRQYRDCVLNASAIPGALSSLTGAWKCLTGEEAEIRLRLRASAAVHGFELSAADVRPARLHRDDGEPCGGPWSVANLETAILRRERDFLIRSTWTAASCDVDLLLVPATHFAPSISTRLVLDLWGRVLAPAAARLVELALPAIGAYALRSEVARPKKVFVSSTFMDLAEHRAQIMEQIQRRDLFFRGMEFFGATSEAPPAKYIQEQVRASDVYLGIFARRYGFVDPASGLSMTELEYDEAVRRKLPRLCYLAHDDAAFRGLQIETDPDKLSKLNKFLAKVNRDVVYRFRDIADLARQVYADLGDQSRLTAERGLC